ncbi:hypothetical protein FOA52_015221 [Chlamydomonas sp. UWO 241]|nr:hypothetical protein FOA52_015221 [Chlamydomonas sp. UWO 241]
MDPPPAEHADQADGGHQVIFNHVLLGLKRIEGLLPDDLGKPKLRLVCRAMRQMVDSHVTGMKTSLNSMAAD